MIRPGAAFRRLTHQPNPQVVKALARRFVRATDGVERRTYDDYLFYACNGRDRAKLDMTWVEKADDAVRRSQAMRDDYAEVKR